MAGLKYNLTKFKGKVIAIDGPAGSGKSTTARIIAARLGYQYLDTGAMYRALTWLAAQNGISPSDGDKLCLLAENVSITFETHEDINHVIINGQEVTDEIRSPMVTNLVSEVSAHRGVRVVMVAKQQEMGKVGSIVAEGRDTTTVVFPDADLKIYMKASVKTRAERRLIDLIRIGVSTSLKDLMVEIERRDGYDSGRKHSPLRCAHNALVIDTTDITIEEQVEWILSHFKNVVQ